MLPGLPGLPGSLRSLCLLRLCSTLQATEVGVHPFAATGCDRPLADQSQNIGCSDSGSFSQRALRVSPLHFRSSIDKLIRGACKPRCKPHRTFTSIIRPLSS